MAGVEQPGEKSVATVTAEIRIELGRLPKANRRQQDPITIARLRARFNDKYVRPERTNDPPDEVEAKLNRIRNVANLHQLKW